jgi:predicted  nucleic acid-binding Zn-ribbon protein
VGPPAQPRNSSVKIVVQDNSFRSALNQNLSPLIELQKLDLRIAEIKDQRRKIPERLQAVDVPVREARQLHQQTSASVETLIKERRSHEQDLEAHEAHTEKMKSRLSELKSNKEYQAHLFEIEVANKKKGDIEEKILLCMEQVEQLQRTAKEAQEKLSAIEKAFAQEKQVLDELEHRLSMELADLEAQQQACSAHVEKGLLSRYNSIKASRKDHALAEIKEGICSGCRLQLPPQLISEVKRAQDLHTCPYCRRMLYWDGQIPVESTPSSDLDKTSILEIGESV